MEDKKTRAKKLEEEGGSGMLQSDPETLHTPDPAGAHGRVLSDTWARGRF